jgi:hypothetical protein
MNVIATKIVDSVAVPGCATTCVGSTPCAGAALRLLVAEPRTRLRALLAHLVETVDAFIADGSQPCWTNHPALHGRDVRIRR